MLNLTISRIWEFPLSMMPKTNPSKAIRIIIVFLAFIGILFAEITLQASIAQADSNERLDARAGTRAAKLKKATRTPKPTKVTTKAGQRGFIFVTPESHMLCGELVFINSFSKIKITPNVKPTVSVIGLRRCDGGGILIFKTRPRDLIQFFQFRDAEIGTGQEICSAYYGCLDRYITTFQNYIGLESCDACGISMLPPTWTQAPLTPYTPTPIPPTRTPWPTPVSPTPSPTLAPEEITPTSDLFELLHGTETPASSAVSQAQPTVTGTPTPQTALSTLAATPTSSQPFYRRIGPLGLLLLALLAFLIPLVIVLRDYLRDR